MRTNDADDDNSNEKERMRKGLLIEKWCKSIPFFIPSLLLPLLLPFLDLHFHSSLSLSILNLFFLFLTLFKKKKKSHRMELRSMRREKIFFFFFSLRTEQKKKNKKKKRWSEKQNRSSFHTFWNGLERVSDTDTRMSIHLSSWYLF